MCLVLFAIDKHPDYSLVVAANRDEFHARPTAPASFWSDAPSILAGRDLTAMGTWLGVSRTGRFAAVTNVRAPTAPMGERSRGDLPRAFLDGHLDPRAAAADVIPGAHRFGPFNLIVGAAGGAVVTDGTTVSAVDRAVRAVSNASETDVASGARPWPKVLSGEARLASILDRGGTLRQDDLFEVLGDRTVAPDDALPDTGVGLERERFLSSAFLVSPIYGTRSSTVVTIDRAGRVTFEERSFDVTGAVTGVVRESFTVQS